MHVTLKYANAVQSAFPELASRALIVEAITPTADVSESVARFLSVSRERLAVATEGEFPEIQAWRRAFGKMGLKPTQYRCAAEALLRRFRKDGDLPRLHPIIDLCNAASLAFAIPIGVFDTSKITGTLEVRTAKGDETYDTFSCEIEVPEVGEIIFVDASDRAHARRWTNRQSGYSAVRSGTVNVLIVAEALHQTAKEDLSGLTAELQAALLAAWPTCNVAAA